MHRYNQKVGLIGLLLGVIILAIGFITRHAQLAGSLAMATILVSVIAAYYYYPAGNDAERPAATDQEHRSR
jgi:uncharacterized membrane protein YphA (DoxX/SURF4 family)